MSREIMNRSYSHLAAQTAHRTTVTTETTETLWNEAPLQRLEVQTQPVALTPKNVSLSHCSFFARSPTQNRVMNVSPETQQRDTLRPVRININVLQFNLSPETQQRDTLRPVPININVLQFNLSPETQQRDTVGPVRIIYKRTAVQLIT